MRTWARIIVGVAFVCCWGHAGLVRAAELPVLSPIPDQSLELGEVFTYDVDATGTPAPIYSLVVGAPTGMTIDAGTGVISWHPTHPTTIGSREVRVRAINAAGFDQESFILEVIRPAYQVQVSSTDGGSVTKPGEGTFDYMYGDIVTFEATPDTNYRFVGWTGTTADEIVCADCTSVDMCVVKSGTLVANFEYIKAWHSLELSSGSGGSVVQPGEGTFPYPQGTVVTLIAAHDAGWEFVGWTGSAVDAGKVASPADGFTTVTIEGDYTLQANFAPYGSVTQYTLIIHATVGGDVPYPGTGGHSYYEGTEAGVRAEAMDGYRFTGWTGTAVDAGKVTNPASANTWVTMDADYTLTANFAAGPFVLHTLTLSSGDGGSVLSPGEGAFQYEEGDAVSVTALADQGYRFSSWSGTAVNAGKVANPVGHSTTVTMDGDYTLCANFTAVGQGSASVTLLAPKGGENLTPGSVVSIMWRIQGAVAYVDIELSVDGGATWTQIVQHAADGSCNWEVPPVDSNRCLIRISSAGDADTCDTSDAPFSIRPAASRIWYVDAAATGAGDGTSWVDASVCLQDALTGAAQGDSILVAEGLYWPDLGDGRKVGDRTVSFQLKTGVAIYGGFPAGGGEWSRRNPAVHRSVLSGDIGVSGVAADNSYHVVTANGVAKTAVLDGCTVCDGSANGADPHNRGAGLSNLWGNPSIRNCTFARNSATADGGGVCNAGGDATFVNCVFTGNTAGSCGGGLYNEQGTVTVINCTLTANQGIWRGGGIFNTTGTVTIGNSILWGNGRQYRNSYDEWAQVSGDSYPAMNRCCVQSWTGSLGGEGNFADDPQFLDADGPDGVAGTPDDDLRLSGGSPCIDAGSATMLPSGITTDLRGKPRVENNHVDIGAYESSENDD